MSGEEFIYLFGPSCKINPLYLPMAREQFMEVLSWNVFKLSCKLQQATSLFTQKQALQQKWKMIITVTRAYPSGRTWACKHLKGSYHFFLFCLFLLLFLAPEQYFWGRRVSNFSQDVQTDRKELLVDSLFIFCFCLCFELFSLFCFLCMIVFSESRTATTLLLDKLNTFGRSLLYMFYVESQQSVWSFSFYAYFGDFFIGAPLLVSKKRRE